MAPNLPGFYYDETRGKYFRIQADRQAVPGVKVHTRTSVNRALKRKQEKQAMAAHQENLRELTIRKSRALEHPLAGKTLTRELGRLTTKLDSIAGEVWASSARKTGSLHIRRSPSMTALAYDYEKDLAFVGDTNGRLHQFYPSILVDGKHLGPSAEGGYTSLDLHHDNILMYSTYEEFGFRRINVNDAHGATIGERIYGASDFTIYGARPRPTDTSLLYAGLATSRGIKINHIVNYDNTTPRAIATLGTPSHVLAVEWRDVNVIAGGCRNGAVILYDCRSEGSQLRLRAPSGACKLFSVDENKLLVAGFNNTMLMYDLRWQPQRQDTPPCVEYPHYVNHGNTQVGFAVSIALGIVATAGDDSRVRLHRLRDGKRMEAAWDYGHPGGKQWAEGVQCLSFVEAEAYAPALLLSSGTFLELYELSDSQSE